MRANSASAIFQVDDLEKSINFYVGTLGFEEVFKYGAPAYYAGVKKDEVIIHLNSGGESGRISGAGSVYIFCDEVDAYYQTLVGKSIEITSKLETWPYDMRDFQIKDIDGNLLCFGCPVEFNGKKR